MGMAVGRQTRANFDRPEVHTEDAGGSTSLQYPGLHAPLMRPRFPWPRHKWGHLLVV